MTSAGPLEDDHASASPVQPSPDQMPDPKVRGLGPLASLLLAAGCGLALGVLTLVGQGILPGDCNALVNSGAVWLVPAFFVGSAMRTDRAAAAAGAGTLLLALVGYYVAAALHLHAPPGSSSIIALWIGCAVIGGPIFGVAGHWWRTSRSWRPQISLALLGGVFVAEGIYRLWLVQTMPVAGWLMIAVGLAIPLALASSSRDRARASLLLLPAAAVILGGYALLRLA
jgi:hypothetical protein